MAKHAKISKKRGKGGFGPLDQSQSQNQGIEVASNGSYDNTAAPNGNDSDMVPYVNPNTVSSTQGTVMPPAQPDSNNIVAKTSKNVTDWFNGLGLFKKKPSQTVSSSLSGGKSKKNKTSKRKRGGYKPNASSGIASAAAPIGNIKTAMPNAWIGGKKRKHTMSKKSRKH